MTGNPLANYCSQACVLKKSVGAVVFLRYFPLSVSSSLLTSHSGGCGLEFRPTAEEPHQPFEVLRGCSEVELLAYEAHPA